MQQQIFSIPTFGGEQQNEEMNKFIRGKKVIMVERQLIQKPQGDYWTFCIQFTEGEPVNPYGKKEKTDYSKTLSPEHFQIFSQLRKLRKQIADSEGLPAYVVFTDDELASISTLENITTSEIRKIRGVGDKRAEKYGETIINFLNPAEVETEGKPDFFNK